MLTISRIPASRHCAYIVRDTKCHAAVIPTISLRYVQLGSQEGSNFDQKAFVSIWGTGNCIDQITFQVNWKSGNKRYFSEEGQRAVWN